MASNHEHMTIETRFGSHCACVPHVMTGHRYYMYSVRSINKAVMYWSQFGDCTNNQNTGDRTGGSRVEGGEILFDSDKGGEG